MPGPADLTDDQLDAYIRARLVIAGVDLAKLPTTADPTTGAPTQTAALASLRDFVRTNPAVINTWRPPVPGASDYDAPRLSQQLAPPLEYPSITEAWTDRTDQT